MVESRPLAALCWLIAAGSLLPACASQTKRHETELAQLLHWLPGSYDNAAQAQTDAQQGVQPPHERLALAIVALDAPSFGRDAFYMQEMAADDPRRVMSQKVLTFHVTDQGIVAGVWSLTDPRRWRDAHLNPDLFRGLVPEDLAERPGCELRWQKTASARAAGAMHRARTAPCRLNRVWSSGPTSSRSPSSPTMRAGAWCRDGRMSRSTGFASRRRDRQVSESVNTRTVSAGGVCSGCRPGAGGRYKVKVPRESQVAGLVDVYVWATPTTQNRDPDLPAARRGSRLPRPSGAPVRPVQAGAWFTTTVAMPFGTGSRRALRAC